MSKTRICVGAFAGAHGVRGEAKVKTFTAEVEGVAEYGPVETEDGTRRFELRFIRALKADLALVSSPAIATREEAAALAGVRLYVARAALPDPAADEFYIEDLIGLLAVDASGGAIGEIAGVHQFGAGPILEVKPPMGASYFLPFTAAVAPTVELAAGRIVIDRAAAEAAAAPVNPADRDDSDESDAG
jgi:16S rRNA processing protein RimM